MATGSYPLEWPPGKPRAKRHANTRFKKGAGALPDAVAADNILVSHPAIADGYRRSWRQGKCNS